MAVICVFIANDAGRFAFEKMIDNDLIDIVVTITEDKAKKLGVTNFLDVRMYKGNYDTYYARKYNLKSEEDIEFFNKLKCDVGFVLGWNRLIPKEILDTFKIGVFGFHGTPFGLPKGRGRSPTIWTLVLGYDRFYLHLFRLTEGVDDGPIIDTQFIPVYETDDIALLHKKTSYWSWKMIERSLDKILKGYEGKPQIGTPVYFRKRTEKDGKIRWNLPSKMIYNLVRAITKPYPGAWTTYKGKKIRVWKVVPFGDVQCRGKPGTVCEIIDGKPLIKTGDGGVLILEYEPSVDLSWKDVLK